MCPEIQPIPARVQGNKRFKGPAVSALAQFAIFCFYGGVKRRFIHYEVHVPVVIDFGWLVNKLLFVLRLPTSLLTDTLIYRYLRTTEVSFAACSIAYLSGPWSIFSALTVHRERMACFTMLVAMRWFCTEADSRRTIGKSILGCVALALKPIVRIYSIFIYPAITGLALANRQYRKLVPYIAAALVPSCIVFWFWKGLTPPVYAATNGVGGQRLMLNAAYLKASAHAGVGIGYIPLALALFDSE